MKDKIFEGPKKSYLVTEGFYEDDGIILPFYSITFINKISKIIIYGDGVGDTYCFNSRNEFDKFLEKYKAWNYNVDTIDNN